MVESITKIVYLKYMKSVPYNIQYNKKEKNHEYQKA